MLESIALDPPSAQLNSDAGSRPTQNFNVIATYSDGTSDLYTQPVEFAIDNQLLGRIDESNGEFTASGVAGGEATVTATPVNAPSVPPATGTVSVDISYTLDDQGLVPDYQDKFTSPTVDAASAPNVVYPLSGAVMPQNVYPADIQWTNGEPG